MEEAIDLRIHLAFALVLLLPSAAATSATLVLESPADIGLAGHVRVVTGSGSLKLADPAARAEWILHVAEGILTFETRESMGANVGSLVVSQPRADPRVEEVRLRDAVIRIRLDDEHFALNVTPVDGAILATGSVDALGSPETVPHPVEGSVSRGGVDTTWKRGWWFVGSYDSLGRFDGYPALAGVELSAHGLLDVTAFGGIAEVTQGNITKEWRLGVSYDEDESIEAPASGAGKRVARAMSLRGVVSHVEFPLADSWGLAAPRMEWHLDGTADWPRASGTVVVDGHTMRVDDARVRAVGNLSGDFARSGSAADTHYVYRFSGDVEDVYVDGTPVVVSATQAERATGIGLLTLLLAALAWFGREVLARAAIVAYSRLTPGDVLAHPTRARIADLVRGQPGIHARELHRIVGGAWGPFRFHLRVLEEFRIVRLERRGRYAIVLPVAKPDSILVIPNETQRRVYEALPADGARVRVRDIAERTGLSRQLVDYHLRALAAQGLVTLTTRVALGPRQVRRATQGPGAAPA